MLIYIILLEVDVYSIMSKFLLLQTLIFLYFVYFLTQMKKQTFHFESIHFLFINNIMIRLIKKSYFCFNKIKMYLILKNEIAIMWPFDF